MSRSEKSKTALWTCPASSSQMSDYTIQFCPNGSDFYGSLIPSDEYLHATASCSSRATSGAATFTVGPSPTSLATKGTLQVQATAAAGVGGQAALADGGETLGLASASDGVPSPTPAAGVAGGGGAASASVSSTDNGDQQAPAATPHCFGGQWLEAVPSGGETIEPC